MARIGRKLTIVFSSSLDIDAFRRFAAEVKENVELIACDHAAANAPDDEYEVSFSVEEEKS